MRCACNNMYLSLPRTHLNRWILASTHRTWRAAVLSEPRAADPSAHCCRPICNCTVTACRDPPLAAPDWHSPMAAPPPPSPASVPTVTKQLTLLLLHSPDGRVLLGEKKRGFGAGKWNGFGGKVDPGENLRDAALREMREESGVEVTDAQLHANIVFDFHGHPERLEVHVFRATRWTGEPRECDEMRPQWCVPGHGSVYGRLILRTPRQCCPHLNWAQSFRPPRAPIRTVAGSPTAPSRTR